MPQECQAFNMFGHCFLVCDLKYKNLFLFLFFLRVGRNDVFFFCGNGKVLFFGVGGIIVFGGNNVYECVYAYISIRLHDMMSSYLSVLNLNLASI